LTFHRRTLRGDARFEGLGLHSGAQVKVTVHPGTRGVAFRQGAFRTAARPENVTDTTRCTRLGEISTIEHLMSALAGLEITDAEIEVEGGEMPGLDGSAAKFVRGLCAAGFEDLGEASIEPPFERVFFHEGEVRVAVAAGEGHWRYEYCLDGRWPGTQVYEAVDAVEEYVEEIAPARTFCLLEEVERIRAAGLGLGLDETSALVLGADGYANSARFENEPARHKLLDLMGDLYLAGVPVRALAVAAERSGHTANVATAALLARCVGG